MNAMTELLAKQLRDAYGGVPIPPMRHGLGPTDVKGAYEIQALNTAYWVSKGRKIVGRKVGLTAKAVQAQLGVDQPDFGVLFADMAIADGEVLFASQVLQPKAEAEVAIVMGADIFDPEVTRADVEAAVAYVSPAIEIVDSRIADWKITFADTVADNGSSGFFVLGADRKLLKGLDIWTCGMALEINGEVRSLGAGAACMGHPLNAATWLARTLAERNEGLRAGDIVLTGALGPMVTMRAGDSVCATIGGLGSASFTCVGDS